MGYTGIIAPIPIGDGGLDARDNKSAVPINKLIKATNVSIKKGIVAKEGGSLKANSVVISGAPSIVGGTEFFPTVTTQRTIISTSDGKLYKDNPLFDFSVTLKTGLGTDKKTVFTEGGAEVSGNDKKLFSYNGFDPIQVLSGDGATTSNIATGSPDWSGNVQPVKGVIHRNRHFVILGHNVYMSTITDHEDFTGSGSAIFPVFPGEGIRLTNCVSIFGRLYVFKEPYGIYFLEDTDNTSTNWVIKKVTGKIGCPGPDALDVGLNECVYLSTDGSLHFLSGSQEFGDVKDTDITAALNLENILINDINRGRLDRAVVRYYEDKKEVWVAYTSATGSRNDRILKLDISQLDNIKASFTNKDSVESLWMELNTSLSVRKPLAGGSDGFVRELDRESRNVDGAAYLGELQIPYTGFEYYDQGLENRNKLFDAIEIQAVPVGDHDITLDIYIDGEYSETRTVNMGTSGTALDTFVLDTNRLDGSGVVNKIEPITGSGKRISLDIYNSGLNQSFEIEKLFCWFRPSDMEDKTNG